MEETYMGFSVGKLMVEMLKLLHKKGVLEEAEILDMLWEAKDPYYPWSKADIKDLLKL